MVPALVAFAVVGVLLLLLREAWLRIWLPALGLALLARGRRRQGRALLLRALSEPSLAGQAGRAEARYRLAFGYMQDGLYEEAISQCRTALAHRLRPAMETNLRRRLADCLEASGDLSGASEERERAGALAGAAQDDADVLIARARLLKQQQRH